MDRNQGRRLSAEEKLGVVVVEGRPIRGYDKRGMLAPPGCKKPSL